MFNIHKLYGMARIDVCLLSVVCLPMLERLRYAVDTVNVCISSCQELYYSIFFPLFLPLLVLKMTRISGNFKVNNGYFLANGLRTHREGNVYR